MAKTKINKPGWWNAPNVFYVGAMRTTDSVGAKKEYELAYVTGGGEVTPVRPE